jgi:CutA1 divalent ion tolerance protein
VKLGMGNGEWGNFRFWILDFGLIGNFKITMTVNFGIVLVTAGSEVEAETIAKSLVENKLAAGVSLSAVRSIYSLSQKDEVLLGIGHRAWGMGHRKSSRTSLF